MEEERVRRSIRQRYARIATQGGSCCGSTAPCCGSEDLPQKIGEGFGYSAEEMNQVPKGSNLGLGCGNPVALASLKRGETVLDLGSGAGFDCFLAAQAVGPEGKVIGVDMTSEMIDKARVNARSGGYGNVEFRLGEIENLPVADGSVDTVLSNCVINLVPDKQKAFREAFRVLKPGGRMMISDLVLLKPLPDNIRSSVEAYTGCIAGASRKEEYLSFIESAGFRDVEVVEEAPFAWEEMLHDPAIRSTIDSMSVSAGDTASLGRSVSSVRVFASKQR